MMMNRSYAQVSTNEDRVEETIHFGSNSMEINSAMQASLTADDDTLRTTTFSHVPEAANLTWKDPYYDGKHGIVAAFDRDTIQTGQWFFWKLMRTAILLYSMSAFYWFMGLFVDVSTDISVVDDVCGIYMWVLGTFIALLAFRGKQSMHCQHVAVTTEGIRIDNGSMMNVTIPLEHIQKIEKGPAKDCCRTASFSIVNVHRSAAPLEQLCFKKTKKLELYGIIRADEFVTLVQAMKESQENGTYEGATAARVELVDRNTAPNTTSPITAQV